MIQFFFKSRKIEDGSLTDIVKGQDENITGTDRPAHTIPYWMKNLNTETSLTEL